MKGKPPRRFEFREGSSDKFWEIAASGKELTTRWGRIGTDGQSKTKGFASVREAEDETAKLIDRKLKEGYSEAGVPKTKRAAPSANRPIDSRIAASVAGSWKRIDEWLTQYAPELMAKMGKPAKVAAIAKAEAALGVELPDDIRASYAIHDGSGCKGFFPSGEYLSLEHMVLEYGNWKSLVEELGFDKDKGDPKGPIHKVHYHLSWIPLTSDGGGDHTLIDLAPAKGGRVGQLIDFSHETGPEQVAARSLAEYLATFADALSGTGIEQSDTGGLYWFRENGMARSAFPTRQQQAALQERERARKFSKHYLVRFDRFWEVTHAEKELTIRSGKVGSKGRSRTRTYPNTSDAYLKVGAMIDRKIKEGYVEKA